MSIETWAAYSAAFLILSLIPGPSVFMVIAQSLARGFSGACSCIAGDVLGGVVMMTVAYAGLGTILAASSTTYIAIKWAGVAYMAWLGASQLRSAHQMVQEDLAENLPVATIDKRSFYTGFFVGVLNPKAVLFYIAFLAQFLDPTHALRPQFIILMITSTVIVVVVLGTYALCALRVRRLFESLKARKRMGYAGGSFLLGGSLFLASN